MDNKQAVKELYDRRRASGLCIKCGFNLAINPGKYSMCRSCQDKVYQTPSYKKHRQQEKENGYPRGKVYRNKLRQACFDHYGRECVCCGETEEAFLTLDHINNDGSEHRKKMGSSRGSGTRMKQWLVSNNFPEEYQIQVLCANCNLAKEILGTCPHKEKESNG